MTGCSDWPVTSAYIHIPFCIRKCTYCDFVSYSGQDSATQQAYVTALCREISVVAEYERVFRPQTVQPLRTLFLGGGTPTVLAADQIVRMIEHIRDTFGLEADCECTMEANPGTVSAAGLRQCRSAGINRLSLGLQAVQPHLLRQLGRIHTAADFRSGIVAARAAGFSNINVDILTGLPGQSLNDVQKTVSDVLAQAVTHVSFYSLILEEGTPLFAKQARHGLDLPDEASERAQYHLVRRVLAEHGYHHYEISNSALAGYECRHNGVYWAALPYYGFGAAAHNYSGGLRSSNTHDLSAYIRAYAGQPAVPAEPAGLAALDEQTAWQQARPVARVHEQIDLQEAMRETMLLGLRLIRGVSDLSFRERFGCSLFSVFGREIDDLCRRLLLIRDSGRVYLSERGMDLANQVFLEFVR